MLRHLAKICLPALLLASCTASLPPVDVTQQNLGITNYAGKVFGIESGPADSTGSFKTAVAQAMVRAGFVQAGMTNAADYVAGVFITRPRFDATGFGQLSLQVRIIDKSQRELWSGTATMRVRQNSPAATSELAAKKLADALFSGFPGESGKTITIP